MNIKDRAVQFLEVVLMCRNVENIVNGSDQSFEAFESAETQQDILKCDPELCNCNRH